MRDPSAPGREVPWVSRELGWLQFTWQPALPTTPCLLLSSGSKSEAAGLSAGQCILKVNCSSIASEGDLGILKHFQAFQSCGQEALILEALAADDSAFLQNCGWLLAMSTAIMIMSHYDFCNIFNTKLESIDQRITCYQQFAVQLKSRVSPAFKQAAVEPHVLCSLNFWPTNCHVNLMEVFNPKMTSSVGKSFSIQFGRKPSLIGLDPKQASGSVCQEDQGLSSLLKQEDHEVQDAYLQLFTKLDMAFKEMKHFVTQINRLLSTIMEPTPNGACYPHLAKEASSSLMVSVDSEMDRTDHRGIKKVCFKLSEENLEDSGHNTMSYHGCGHLCLGLDGTVSRTVEHLTPGEAKAHPRGPPASCPGWCF
ncbi:Phosphatidylinositol 3,4,5-trisphosphate-dependent Rac exchanger 1 protein [Sciurus carolinensis]|uniref:Phosphatidylinositol 3,4,5-trisphosphate-dependent Rac exchanger 1 protein n=1 Tax=Sciurus carolinensis TaxID=30640 RepID=A0AA41N2D3_SCICA|nr:Phosphatidylinositol 3,4,5-trisphosphate-dependent Rac exchanger 1 protein [Sciurus carolinensis]